MSNTRKGREIASALLKKGWRRERDGNHTWYTFLIRDGAEFSVHTLMSHNISGKTVSRSLMARMAKQLHLTNRQFLNFIDCRLSEEDYRKLLSDREIV
jgi:hypothetical protein